MQHFDNSKRVITAYRFGDHQAASTFAARCRKLMSIVLGDDEKYWVVTPADATRLQKLGYETEDAESTQTSVQRQ